jgi:hypothetical protein
VPFFPTWHAHGRDHRHPSTTGSPSSHIHWVTVLELDFSQFGLFTQTTQEVRRTIPENNRGLPSVKIVYVVLEAQYRGRDEEQVHQPRAQSLGPCGVAPAENEPALVQVHIHGGDARQRRWRHTSVKASPLPFQNARDL